MKLKINYNFVIKSVTTVLIISFSCVGGKRQKGYLSTINNSSGKNFPDHSKEEKNIITRNINRIRSQFLEDIKEKYNKNFDNYLVKGTTGGAILNELVWILKLIDDKTITDNEYINKSLNTAELLSSKLKKLKKINKNLIWQINSNEIDERLLPKKAGLTKKQRLDILLKNLKSKLSNEDIEIQKKLERVGANLNNIESITNAPYPKSSFIRKTIFSIKAETMMFMIFERGLLSPNWFFWFLNDLLIKDKSGIETYIEGRDKFGLPITPISFGGKTTYVVVDNNFAKQIYYLSPKVFGPGQVKWRVFRTFMPKNVGITADYKEWHNRRKLNEEVLSFKIEPHIYAEDFNKRIKREINKKGAPKNPETFFDLAKRIVCSIVFNDSENIPDCVFKMFKEANTIKSILSEKNEIRESTLQEVHNFFLKNITNPKPKSLISFAKEAKNFKYCKMDIGMVENCPHLKSKINICCLSKKGKCCKFMNKIFKCCRLLKQKGKPCLHNSSNHITNKNSIPSCTEELLDQIPHWMFPMMKLLYTTLPRMLLLLANHPDVFKKIQQEIESIDINDHKQIYKLQYVRKCVLETLRLNNVTVVTLRRLKQDYSFDYNDKYKFKKDTEFVILSNPILREAEKYSQPNRFMPERWDEKGLEESSYAVMFNQGPQICAGKNLALFIAQSFIAHYLKSINFNLKSDKINTDYIEQMINPLKIKFY